MISNQKDNAINIERPRFETLWAITSKLKLDIKKYIPIHEPLLLDRSVCLPLYSMWPNFGYFSTVI